MFRRIAFALVALACAGLVAAQTPTLSATVNQSPSSVTMTVSGAAPGAHVLLAASLTQGSYPMMMGITLGIVPPFIIMDMGTADAAGQVTRTYPLGSLPPGTTVYAQAASVVMSMGGMGGGGMGGMGGGGMGGGGMGGGPVMMTILLTNVVSFVS